MFLEVNQGPGSEVSDSLRLKALFNLSSMGRPSSPGPLTGHPGIRCENASPDATPVSFTICNDHFSKGKYFPQSQFRNYGI